MLHVLIWLTVFVLSFVCSLLIPSEEMWKDLKYIVFTVSFLIGSISLICMINGIRDAVAAQIKDRNQLLFCNQKINALKSTYQMYRDEMKDVLLQQYKEFEQALYSSITDGSLLATVLKESNYHQTISLYEKQCRNYLDQIHEIGDNAYNLKIKMLNRQQDLLGYGLFIGGSLRCNPYR